MCKFSALPRSTFYKFFSKGKTASKLIQNLLRLIFSGKLKFPRASRHLISLTRRVSVKKVNFEPCANVWSSVFLWFYLSRVSLLISLALC